jgi:DNA-binding NtrC family response regulator
VAYVVLSSVLMPPMEMGIEMPLSRRFVGVHLSLDVGRRNGEVWISVADTGPGISPDEQRRIFQPFTLVVTDLRMPDGDGLGVFRLAKAHCPEAAVILLTAYAGWESAKEAMRLGAYDYFEKGKEPDEFLHRHYPWPGNVRELENAMERTAILAQHDIIVPDDLPTHILAGTPLGAAPSLPQAPTLAEAERVHILQTLERFGWNHSRAAEALAIGRTSLWRKLKEYQIEQRVR